MHGLIARQELASQLRTDCLVESGWEYQFTKSAHAQKNGLRRDFGE